MMTATSSTIANEYAAFLKSKNSQAPGEVSLEMFTARFALGRTYQMEQYSNSLQNVNAALGLATDAGNPDPAAANKGGAAINSQNSATKQAESKIKVIVPAVVIPTVAVAAIIVGLIVLKKKNATPSPGKVALNKA